MSIQQLREECFGATEFSESVLHWIKEQNLWNIWVPKAYGGMELPLSEGLSKLREVAWIDGSLGWTLTLCSGANFFIGNLRKEVAGELFNSKPSPILGGSGGAFGTAEKIDSAYMINGTWKFATGAPYLTHFTLNARITENGQVLKNADGTTMIRSFILPKDQVELIPDWATMGLKATVTYSFKVDHQPVPEKYSFTYDQTYHDQPVFKVPFAVFADLTLWINCIGMAAHYLEEAEVVLKEQSKADALRNELKKADDALSRMASEVEAVINKGEEISEERISEVHQSTKKSVQQLGVELIQVYQELGIRACSNHHVLNQIFRDFFTATQHQNFSR